MAFYQVAGWWTGGPETYVSGIGALSVVDTGAGLVVYSSASSAGGVQVWDGATGAALGQADHTGPATAGTEMRIETGWFGGEAVLWAFGQDGTGLTGHRLAGDGTIRDTFHLSTGAGALTGTAQVAGGTPYWVTSGASGATVWRAAGDDLVVAGRATPATAGAGFSDIAVIEAAGGPVLLATDAAEARLSGFRVTADGSTSPSGTIAAADGLAMGGALRVETVSAGWGDFALVSGSATSSVAVAQVGAQGTLKLTDQVNDDRTTRFEQATALDAVTLGDRVFVVAGGSDDGLSLMTLLPGGRLLHLGSIADGYDTGLQNVTALAAAVEDGRLAVFAASGSEAGVTRIDIDPGALAPILRASAGGGVLTGDARGDMMIGGAGADRLSGGDGADILVDGAGQDVLFGGAGADVFVLAADGARDVVGDFELGIDRLDLSAWGRMYDVSALDITETATGLILRFGDETVELVSRHGGPIDPDMLRTSDVTDLWHVAPNPASDPPVTLTGGSGDDLLTGGTGDDVLTGMRGHDVLRGNGGDDVLNGEFVETGFDTIGARVFRLYQATLGREPDQAGHLGWTGFLSSGKMTQLEIAQGFLASREFQTRYADTDTAEFVTLLYNNVLGRAPDEGGLASWATLLDSGAKTRAQVVIGFSDSAEFIRKTTADSLEFSRAGHAAAWTDDVFRLYQATLGREPDQAGLRAWSELLASGKSLQSTATGFVNSREFNAVYGETSDTGFVALLYNNVLNRQADAAGLSSWVSALEEGTLSRPEVVLRFSQSAEFRHKSAPALEAWVLKMGEDDRLEGGAGTNLMFGGAFSDTFVFTSGDKSRDTVADLESWDRVLLEGFGYDDAADAMAHLRQSGDDVIFADQGTQVLFTGTDMADITADMFLFG